MTVMRLNLRHLRAYLAVHQTGGVTSAAAQAHLSQPAITQALAKLETTIGAPLFDRTPKGMSPTPVGQVFAPRVSRALDGLRTGCVGAARKAGHGTTASLELAITSTQLHALDAVARHGNYSVAARAVGVAQPTLYRLARGLEQTMSFALFETTHAGLALTPAALVMNRAARLMSAELAQALDDARDRAGQGGGTLVIGSLPLSRARWLPNAVARLTCDAPETHVRIVDGPYGDLLHDLRDGTLDMILGALRDPPPARDVMQDVVFHDQLGVFCGPGHPLASQTQVTRADLADYPWIVPRTGTPTRAFFDSFAATHLETPRAAEIETSSMSVVRGVLEQSARLTMVSVHQAEDERRRGTLCQLPVDLGDKSRPIGITTRKAWHPTRTQRRFLDILRDVARRDGRPA